MRNVMKKAWEIAREGANKFGGKAKEYFAEALRMAWAIVKKGMDKVRLVGSEKQVAWAESIREDMIKIATGVYETVQSNNYKVATKTRHFGGGRFEILETEDKIIYPSGDEKFDKAREVLKKGIEALSKVEDAVFFIENRENIANAVALAAEANRMLGRMFNAYARIKEGDWLI